MSNEPPPPRVTPRVSPLFVLCVFLGTVFDIDNDFGICNRNVAPDRSYPLSQTTETFRHLIDGEPAGRIVVTP